MPRPARLHIALVVVGATLAIMLLAVLQVALPILLGLWGLATVLLLDLAVAVFYHHRRVVHDRTRQTGVGHPPLGLRPADQRYVGGRADASEREITATTLFVALLLCLCVAGKTVEGAALVDGLDWPLYAVGATMTLLGVVLIASYFYEYAPRMWRPGLDDTTDDE